MSMGKGWVAGLAGVLLLVSACSVPKTPHERAGWMYEKAAEKIAESLQDQGVEGERLDRVKQVLVKHRSAIVGDVTVAFSEQRDTLRSLYTGQDTEALLEAEDRSHLSVRSALRSIGDLYAELETVVGAETWAAANEERRQRFDERASD